MPRKHLLRYPQAVRRRRLVLGNGDNASLDRPAARNRIRDRGPVVLWHPACAGR